MADVRTILVADAPIDKEPVQPNLRQMCSQVV